MRTRVGIIGAGPAGLLLSHLLARQGIENVVLEARDRAYVERRIRAGVLEQQTVDVLRASGVGERLDREGLTHHGVELRFDGVGHRIVFSELTDGKTIMVYGQQEVVKDLIRARLEAGGQIIFGAAAAQIKELLGPLPKVRFRRDGDEEELVCDVVAGCDGFHGVARSCIPAEAIQLFDRTYPFAWLGILAAVAPSSEELIYASHERGFALHSMRSPELTRLYLQCAPDEDLQAWPDERIWDELQARLWLRDGWKLESGPILDRGITAMRSFVVEPMQFGRLYLAGDAAHIVPPTGAKGMNLAIADVVVLARALTAWFHDGQRQLLEGYSDACLRRVWRAEHFSWWMTAMLHRYSDDVFERRLQLSQLRYVVSSRAAATSLAENYVGLEQVG